MDTEIKSPAKSDMPREPESRPPHRGPAYSNLQKFVGEWKTEGVVKATPSSKATKVQGTDRYEWLPGKFFLLHRVAVHMGESKVEAIEIIGYDSDAGHYFTCSFDSEGTKSDYTANLESNSWKIFGKTERFSGRFADDGNTLSGTWEKSDDGKRWHAWMDITLTRVNTASR